MKSLQFLRTSTLLFSAAIFLGAAPVDASTGVYEPRTTTRQWRTHIADAPVKEIHVYVRRASGGTDTYFNMRFGRDGHTFDGRRVYLKHGNMERASWHLNGRTAGGKELVLNSYNGSVYVDRIEVVYEGDRRQRGNHDRRGRHGGYDNYGGGYYDDHRSAYAAPPRHSSRYAPRYTNHEYRYDHRQRYDRRSYDRHKYYRRSYDRHRYDRRGYDTYGRRGSCGRSY